VILAKAGILKGRKATVWTSETDKSAVKILEENGVKYEKLPVVSDGAITADGPVSALKFAEKIVQMLQ
jgi:protease I